MKNKNIVLGVIAVVLIAASFYGGMEYQKSQAPERGQIAFNGQAGNFGGRTGAARGANGGFVAGQILSSDASGITIKMQDGSTKIILIGSSSQILKSAQGTSADLTPGTNVMVSGSPNADGSVTAQSVQIRPQGFGTTTPAR